MNRFQKEYLEKENLPMKKQAKTKVVKKINPLEREKVTLPEKSTLMKISLVLTDLSNLSKTQLVKYNYGIHKDNYLM